MSPKVKNIQRSAALVLCALLALLLAGCRVQITVSSVDSLVGEEYPDAQRYRVGPLTYDAAQVKAVEVYWRSGQVELTESEDATLTARESGTLPADAAMHWLLDSGVLRIRFCASNAEIRVDPSDKYLRLAVPRGIDLSVHTTAAPIKAEALTQNSVLLSAHSGDMELGAVTAQTVDLSASSGSIRAAGVSAQTLSCKTSSGSTHIAAVSAPSLTCTASSGSVTLGAVTSDSARITTRSGAVLLALTQATNADIQTSSGKVALTLPAAGAEVLYTTHSGTLTATPASTRKGDLYVFGPGESQIRVETASGNLFIQ